MRRIRIAVVVLVLAGAGWWLFGWRTWAEGPYVMTARRTFGRYTQLDVRADRMRGRYFYSWRDPLRPGVHPIHIPTCWGARAWYEDGNADGKWDQWVSRTPPDRDGRCALRYGVDLNADGQADWRFVARADDVGVQARIRQRRGW